MNEQACSLAELERFVALEPSLARALCRKLSEGGVGRILTMQHLTYECDGEDLVVEDPEYLKRLLGATVQRDTEFPLMVSMTIPEPMAALIRGILHMHGVDLTANDCLPPFPNVTEGAAQALQPRR